MALIGLKQLDSILTGSLQVSGSSHVTGSLVVSTTGSFGRTHATTISASGYIYGDGSQLRGITSGIFQQTGSVQATTNNLQITGSVTATSTGSFGRIEADRVQAKEFIISSSVTNISIATLSGSTQFGDDHSDIHQFTGSVKFDSTLFDIYDDSDELMFKIQNKMAILGTITGAPPSAIAGGIYYSGSDAWYLGYETSPT
jgi:hypothetical protein